MTLKIDQRLDRLRKRRGDPVQEAVGQPPSGYDKGQSHPEAPSFHPSDAAFDGTATVYSDGDDSNPDDYAVISYDAHNVYPENDPFQLIWATSEETWNFGGDHQEFATAEEAIAAAQDLGYTFDDKAVQLFKKHCARKFGEARESWAKPMAALLLKINPDIGLDLGGMGTEDGAEVSEAEAEKIQKAFKSAGYTVTQDTYEPSQIVILSKESDQKGIVLSLQSEIDPDSEGYSARWFDEENFEASQVKKKVIEDKVDRMAAILSVGDYISSSLPGSEKVKERLAVTLKLRGHVGIEFADAYAALNVLTDDDLTEMYNLALSCGMPDVDMAVPPPPEDLTTTVG